MSVALVQLVLDKEKIWLSAINHVDYDIDEKKGLGGKRYIMKERELFEITYLPLHISLLALEDAKLPKYLGSTLRGILGQALYKTNREVYKFLYKNGKQCKDKQDIVKPYIIIPPVVCGTELFVKKGEELNFEILLLGDAIQYASALIAALQKAEQFGMGAQRYSFSFI